MAKRGGTRLAARVPEWAVGVRLRDGDILFWTGPEEDRWGRESRAYRFPDRTAAEEYASAGQISAHAKEYVVVRLNQPRR